MELIRLKIELYEDLLFDEEKVNIKKHLKTGDDYKVVRDVIVFGDMRLNNLHFLIQKLFNFQNYHHRIFSISDNDLIRVTNNKLSNYIEMLGTLFQAPEIYKLDLYWNDDYDEGMSYNKFLKSKYTPPYYYGGKFDEPYYAKALFSEIIKRYNIDVSDSLNINEAKDIFRFNIFMNHLSENLRVEDLFVNSMFEGSPIAKEINYIYDLGTNHSFKIKYMKNYKDLNLTKEEVNNLKQTVTLKNSPICIYAKGLHLTEDNGSLGSFANSLEEAKKYSKEELESFNNWLKHMGFKKTIGNIKTML